jgi:hypothetical protein
VPRTYPYAFGMLAQSCPRPVAACPLRISEVIGEVALLSHNTFGNICSPRNSRYVRRISAFCFVRAERRTLRCLCKLPSTIATAVDIFQSRADRNPAQRSRDGFHCALASISSRVIITKKGYFLPAPKSSLGARNYQPFSLLSPMTKD